MKNDSLHECIGKLDSAVALLEHGSLPDRTDFEALYLSIFPNLIATIYNKFARDDSDDYIDPCVFGAWAMYKAMADKWQPIETAPEHEEVICCRPDSGVFVAQLTVPEAVIPGDELERMGTDAFPDDFKEWWSDSYGWLENDLKPTHWQPLPKLPA